MNYFPGELKGNSAYNGFVLNLNETEIVSKDKNINGFFIEEACLNILKKREEEEKVFLLESDDFFYIISFNNTLDLTDDTYIYSKEDYKNKNDLELILSQYEPDNIIDAELTDDGITIDTYKYKFEELNLTTFLSLKKKYIGIIKTYALPVSLIGIIIPGIVIGKPKIEKIVYDKINIEKSKLETKKGELERSLKFVQRQFKTKVKKRAEFNNKKDIIKDITLLNKEIENLF
jgi:hypothetical protein